MTDDIVARLRRWSLGCGMWDVDADIRDAADEIERLREALRIEQEEVAACCIDRKETQRERDEARWEVCELSSNGSIDDATRIYVERGWDCFKENKENTDE